MAIDIGDAVLTFLGDTTQLDAAYQRVGAEAPAKMAPATAAVTETSSAVEGMTERMAVGAQGAVEMGEVTTLAGEKAQFSMYEARGEAGLLGEMFGIHLPRHVRSFIAELPGVGTALSAAFAATAVLFIIEAVAKGIEKIVELSKAGEKVKEAMEAWDDAQRKTFNNLSDGVLRAQAHLAELNGNHLEALRLKLQLIDNQNLDKLDDALKKLGADADKVFGDLQRSWFMKELFDLPGSDEAQGKLKELQKAVSEALKTRTPEAYGEALKTLQGEFDTTTSRLQKLDDQLSQHNKDMQTALGPRAKITEAPDPKEIQAWEQLGKTIRGYISDVQEAKKQGDTQKQGEQKSEALKQAEEEVAEQKRLLAQRLADIELERDKSRALFAEKKIDAATWAASEKQAVTDTAAAHQRYGQVVVDIYKKAGESMKAHAAAQAAELQGTKQADELVKGLAKSTDDLDAANKEFAKTSAKIWKDTQKEMEQVTDDVKKMQERDPFLPWQRSALRLNADLKNLGIQGFVPMQQHLDAANKAEKALNDAGIHEGKLWLQVQAAKLKAVIALDQAEGKSATREIRDLQNIERELQKFDKAVKSDANAMLQFKNTMKGALDSMSSGFQSAIQAWISGEKSLGQALADSAKEAMAALSARAAQEALWDAAKGLVALATGDGAAAGQYFAAAEIMGLIAVTSGFGAKALGGGGSKGASGSGGGSSNQATIQQNASTQAGKQPVSTVNLPHLFSGALVDRPTNVVVGDDGSGGSQLEGIFPLGGSRAQQMLDRMFGGHGPGEVHNHFHVQSMIGASNLAQLARLMTRATNSGRVSITVRNSGRITRR